MPRRPLSSRATAPSPSASASPARPAPVASGPGAAGGGLGARGGGAPVPATSTAAARGACAPSGRAGDRAALGGLAPAEPGTLRIGLVATFARWKGHETFLRALHELSGARIRGYVIGGPLYDTAGSQHTVDQLRAAAAALRLAHRARLTGSLQPPPAPIPHP